VTREGESDDFTLERLVAEIQVSGIVINAAPPEELENIAKSAELAAPVLGVLPQDRLLAAPSFNGMAQAVGGTLVGPEHLYTDAAEWLVVGPISAHGGMPYFDQFPHAVVVTRHDRVDIALGALNQHPAGLILTGGEPTLPYVAQRAESEEFALIVTGLSTADAVKRIGDLYAQGSFEGTRKAQRAIDLVAAHLNLDILQASATV
jgi:phosphate acetyltransferase